MVWLITSILGAIFATGGYVKTNRYNKNSKGGPEKDPVFAIICTVVAVLAAIICIVQGIDGITDYPYLVSKLAKIEAVRNRIEDVRASNYAHQQEGQLVAGSIENYQQSTNLSKYISQLAAMEAQYNGYFEVCKAYKETFVLWFFGNGWAISNKIYDLKYIG